MREGVGIGLGVSRAGGEPPPLLLRTFGSPALLRPRQGAPPEVVLEPSKLLALVAYLAFAPGRTATRDGLIDLLWADLDPDAGRHAVRQHLWQLKRKLGSDVEVEGRDQLVLRTAIDSDRAQFVAASEQADFARAVQLYTGDFFPGFAGVGAGEFERWVDGERWELRSRFVRCAEVVVRDHMNSHRSREAIALARRIREVEPLRQHGWRILLEALLAGNDAVSAAVECDSLERLLAQEGMRLEPATKGLVAAVRRAGSLSASSGESLALQPELVGREREFATLMSAWDRAARGHSVHVVITAQAGLGKTRLLSELCARLQSMRARCVMVRGNSGATTVPYALVSDLAEKLGHLPGARGVSPQTMQILVALSPALSSAFDATPSISSPADATRHRWSALRDLVLAVASERPVAILVDDLHWADVASRTVLESLAGSLSDASVLLCVSSRVVHRAPPAAGSTTLVELKPLSESAVLSLVSSVAALPIAPWADRLVAELTRRMRGVPLYLVESLQLALQEQLLAIRDGEWACTDADQLWHMMDSGGVLRRRLDRLEEHEQRVLQVLAIAAEPTEPHDVVVASEAGSGPALAALASLQAKGLIISAAGGVSVAHDELASVAVEGMPESERSRVDRSLGTTLARGGGDARRLRSAAKHLLRARAEAQLRTLFADYVAEARRRRDRRSATVLAAEMLGEGAPRTLAQTIVRALPISVRMGAAGAGRNAMIVGTTFLLIGFTVGALLSRNIRLEPPDALLHALVTDTSGRVRVLGLPLREASWRAAEPLRLGEDARVLLELDASWAEIPIQSPVRPEQWVGVRHVADSGVSDLFLISESGRRLERLTDAVGDDVEPDWSPDGRFIVFSTARWRTNGGRDIAVLEVETREVRRFSNGMGNDGNPHWSPDGTRIAFERQSEGGSRSVCIAGLVDRRSHCDFPPPALHFQPVGWDSDSSLLGTGSTMGERIGARFLVTTNSWQSIDTRLRLSASTTNGLWIAGSCGRLESEDDFCVRPRSRSGASRRVLVEVRASLGQLGFGEPPGDYLDTVRIRGPAGNAIVGVPFELSYEGRSQSGRLVPVRHAAVRSLDVTTVRVDSAGRLVGIRPGTVKVELSAGGWRADTALVQVVAPPHTTFMIERWSTLSLAWRKFGEPDVQLVNAAAGESALYVSGDGTFHSGVYSAASFDGTSGLALRARVSTPINRRLWQSLHIVFLRGLNSRALAAWDHRAGYLWNPSRFAGQAQMCGMVYPEPSESVGSRDSLKFEGYVREPFVRAVPGAVKEGRWYTVVVQLFPDGRCGVAIDGVPLGETLPGPDPLDSVRVAFFGNSVGTRILVGRTELRKGILPGIDWSKQDRARASPPR